MTYRFATVGITLLSPVVTYAGTTLVQPAPTLGEVGLIALGVSLVGIGVAYLRRR